MVHQSSLATKQDQQPPITETAADSGKLTQPDTQISIVGPHAAIPHRGPVGANCLARPPLAHLIGLAEVNHSLPLHDGRHHFFALMSFSIALSSIASVRNFFSL